MLDDSLYDYLQTFVGITNLVGTRIWPDALPQKPVKPVMPAMVWQCVSDVPAYSHGGDSGLDEARYQFTCWGSTPLQVRQLAIQVRVALGGKVVALPDGTKFRSLIESMRRSDEPTTGLYRFIVDVNFLHTP